MLDHFASLDFTTIVSRLQIHVQELEGVVQTRLLSILNSPRSLDP